MSSIEEYPKDRESIRRYRLWSGKKQLPGCYSIVRHCHDGAMSRVRWGGRVGESIAVIDIHHGKLLGEYTLKVGGIKIYIPTKGQQ